MLTSRHLLCEEGSSLEPAQGEINEQITLNFFDLERPLVSKSHRLLA